MTDIPGITPPPQIEFLQKDDRDAFGRCFVREGRIEIYLGSIYRSIWNYRERYAFGLGYKQAQALFYNTVAHEMLHYALHVRRVPARWQHKVMRDGRYLERVADFISNHFQISTDGFNKSITMVRLDRGVAREER